LETFTELIEAASKGNQRNVDVFSDELMADAQCAEGDDSAYAFPVEDIQQSLVFCFGKAVGKEIGIGTATVLMKLSNLAFTVDCVMLKENAVTLSNNATHSDDQCKMPLTVECQECAQE